MFNPDLTTVHTSIRELYEPVGMQLSDTVIQEQESANYGACRFVLNGFTVVFRVARTTPTKVGQFVTLWKRLRPGEAIVPLDADDPVDFVIVCTSNTEHRGQFIFNRDILLEKGVLSSARHVGKRALRVYPPWSHPLAKEAVRTQEWQLPYFLSISEQGTADRIQIKQLFDGFKSTPAGH